MTKEPVNKLTKKERKQAAEHIQILRDCDAEFDAQVRGLLVFKDHDPVRKYPTKMQAFLEGELDEDKFYDQAFTALNIKGNKLEEKLAALGAEAEPLRGDWQEIQQTRQELKDAYERLMPEQRTYVHRRLGVLVHAHAGELAGFSEELGVDPTELNDAIHMDRGFASAVWQKILTHFGIPCADDPNEALLEFIVHQEGTAMGIGDDNEGGAEDKTKEARVEREIAANITRKMKRRQCSLREVEILRILGFETLENASALMDPDHPCRNALRTALETARKGTGAKSARLQQRLQEDVDAVPVRGDERDQSAEVEEKDPYRPVAVRRVKVYRLQLEEGDMPVMEPPLAEDMAALIHHALRADQPTGVGQELRQAVLRTIVEHYVTATDIENALAANAAAPPAHSQPMQLEPTLDVTPILEVLRDKRARENGNRRFCGSPGRNGFHLHPDRGPAAAEG